MSFASNWLRGHGVGEVVEYMDIVIYYANTAFAGSLTKKWHRVRVIYDNADRTMTTAKTDGQFEGFSQTFKKNQTK